MRILLAFFEVNSIIADSKPIFLAVGSIVDGGGSVLKVISSDSPRLPSSSTQRAT